MLSRVQRFFRVRQQVSALGRWDPHRTHEQKMRIAELADHDGCGAHQCAKPDQTQKADECAIWCAKYYAPGRQILRKQ